MDDRNIAMLLALMRAEGVGNAVARRALCIAQTLALDVRDLHSADPRELLIHGAGFFPDTVINALKRVHDDALNRADRHVNRLLQHGVSCFVFSEDCYPGLLATHLGESAPALVWCVGNHDLLHAYNAGIVGTRSPSRTGHAIAVDCARALRNDGVCIVSGGADGIDTAAHRGALESGGTSVVVLPQGLRTYTFPNYIREAIESNRCAIISQFDPEMKWQTHAAVTRNATIAALSKLVCVIEPKRMGGSMRTAQHARDQGKCVFYYCAQNGEEFARTLQQWNGSPLLQYDMSLDTNSLHLAWKAVTANGPTQGKLL